MVAVARRRTTVRLLLLIVQCISFHSVAVASFAFNRISTFAGPSCLFAASSSDGEEESPTRQQDRLRSLLNYVHTYENDPNKLPCGLDCSEKERELIKSVIQEVEADPENLVTVQQGKIDADDLFGDWSLLYTSSPAMLINKSLSGLGRSESNVANFKSLIQKLGGNKFLGSVEFVERFGGSIRSGDNDDGDDEQASLDVSITGEWFTLAERNPITGAPNTAIEIQPETIVYGPKANAKEWASLSPIKRMDIIYLSEDFMISRGNVNLESLFVWERIK
jgi:hypothetical protein